MLSKIREIFRWHGTRPPLRPDEGIVLEGGVEFSRAMMGVRVGRLILTNQRLLWYEETWGPPAPRWLLKPYAGEIALADIASVDKGTLLDFIGGGRRLRLRLRSDKDKCFFENEGKLNEWIAAIRYMIS